MTDYATHPDYLALLRGVLHDPADDMPRYAISDWLEEFGTPDAVTRGRFVRADVRLAATGLTTCPTPVPAKYGPGTQMCRGCEYCHLWRERWNLLDPWRGVVPACPAPHGFAGGPMRPGGTPSVDDRGPWLYAHRGFFWHMWCTVAEFVGHAAAVFAAHPVVRVTLNDCADLRGEMSRVPPENSWCWRFSAAEGARFSLTGPLGMTAGQVIVRHGRGLAGLPPFTPDALTAGTVAPEAAHPAPSPYADFDFTRVGL